MKLSVKIAPFCLVLLSGCQGLRSPVEDLDLELPDTWLEAEGGGGISTAWVATFGDSDLEELVAEAMAQSHDLGAAAGRLEIAEAGRVGGRAARLPRLSYGGGASGSRDEAGPDDSSVTSENYRLSMNLSWELDLWGRLRDRDRAAEEDLRASRADFHGARLSLAANTAKAWFNLITAEQQAQLAEETRDSFVRNHRITERNYKAGDLTTSPLSVQLGRSNVSSAERSLVRTRLNRDEASRSLELLLGRYPGAELLGRETLPTMPPLAGVGLPSELLMRRPDLVAAEAGLQASAHRADAARKDLLPSVDLSGGLSSADRTLGKILLDPEYFVWSAAASLAGTIYNGGAPTAAARRALAQNEVELRSFASLALRAFREVESAISTERSLAEQEQFLTAEVAQANLAEAQASRDYSDGLVNIISLLEAQRRAVNARTAQISLRNQRHQNRIDLHLALGGAF